MSWNATPAFAYQEPDLGRNGLPWSGPPTRLPDTPVASIFSSLMNAGNRIVFSSLRRAGLQLQRPIALRIERENRSFLVASDELDVYGVGDTLGAALGDFELTLQELFDRLNEPEVQLGPGLRELRDVVNSYLMRRGQA